jgi:ribosome-binding protein aMBF1 (putative translation factor)
MSAKSADVSLPGPTESAYTRRHYPTMGAAHNTQYVEFVTRLRNARRARGLTQSELGRLLRKPQAFVSKVERCERRLDVIEAAEWCLALQVRIDDVLPARLRTSLARDPDPTGKSL